MLATGPSLDQQIALLHSGDHICLPYVGRDEQFEPLRSFARHGLTRGERLFFIGPRAKLDELLAELDSCGIDTRRAIERGAIAHAERPEFYRPHGRQFSVQSALDAVAEQVQAAQRAGFTGLRGVTDIVSLETEPAFVEAIVEYETRFEKEFRRQPLIAMCQFDRRGIPPAYLRRLLCAHPKALAGGHVCGNPYFEPARVIDEPDTESMRVEWMLRQIDRAHRDEERREAYAQSLASQAASLLTEVGQRRRSEDELARVLQHRDAFLSLASQTLGATLREVRTDLNALLQHQPERSGRVLGQVALLETIAEQMHEVGCLPGRRGLKAAESDLAAVVRECAGRHADDLSEGNAALQIEADRPIPGRWDRARVEQLLDSLLSRASRCGRGLPVRVTAAPDGPDRARIEIRTAAPTGDASHESLTEPFQATLWLPRAAAESMNGALTVTGSPLSGEEIVVELPSAPAPPA